MNKIITQTESRTLLGEFAPMFTHTHASERKLKKRINSLQVV